ncbi:MAG TPA: class II aldolase/adducin family protein [Nitriliruptorales bacterium]|nr:class II aldolase/adducin family protein [Nitriliruptorales bacterium]
MLHPVAEPRASRKHGRLAVNVAVGSRALSLDGHDDLNQGQLSARLPGSSSFVIKSAVCGFVEATPEDCVVAQVDASAPVDRMAPPELPLHQAIYEARPDVNAIVHSHAPYTLVFGATGLSLLPVSHDGACFAGRLNRFELTSNTVLNIATGRAVAAELATAQAILMQNHGSVVVGKSLREAVVLAQVLERACRLQLLAEAAGVPYRTSSAKDVAAKQAYIYSDSAIKSYWEFCVRQVRRTWPETAQWRS